MTPLNTFQGYCKDCRLLWYEMDCAECPDTCPECESKSIVLHMTLEYDGDQPTSWGDSPWQPSRIKHRCIQRTQLLQQDIARYRAIAQNLIDHHHSKAGLTPNQIKQLRDRGYNV